MESRHITQHESMNWEDIVLSEGSRSQQTNTVKSTRTRNLESQTQKVEWQSPEVGVGGQWGAVI